MVEDTVQNKDDSWFGLITFTDENDLIKVIYMEGNALDENIRSVHTAIKKAGSDPKEPVIFKKEDFD